MAVLACVSSSCVIVPIHPTAPTRLAAVPLADARFEIAPSSLSTSSGLPAPGSNEHEELRQFLVEQLDHAAGARAHASVALPTRVELERQQAIFSGHRVLHIALTTSMPRGTVVETTFEVEGASNAGRGNVVPEGDAGCGRFNTRSEAGPVYAVSGVWGVPAAFAYASKTVANRHDPLTTAYSNGLQRAVIRHAQAVARTLAEET